MKGRNLLLLPILATLWSASLLFTKLAIAEVTPTFVVPACLVPGSLMPLLGLGV